MSLPLPRETVSEMQKQVEEMRKLTSSIVGLVYNNWLLQNMPRWTGNTPLPFQQQLQPQEPKKEEDILAWYEKALKVKALQSIVSTSPESLVQQPAEKEKEKEEDEEGPGEQLWNTIVELIKKDPKAAKEFLSNITDDDIQKMQMFANITGKPNPLLPWLMFSRRMEKGEESKPKTNDVAEMTKTVMEALKTGVEIGKSSTPSQQGTDQLTNTLLQAVLELLKGRHDEESRKILEGIYAALEKKENFYEKLLTDKSLRDTLKGLFASPSLPAETQIELEKLRNELTGKELELRKWLAEMQMKQRDEARKLKLIDSIVKGPAGNLLSDMGKKVIEGVAGGAVAGAGAGALAAKAVQQPLQNMMAIRCGNCGTVFQVPEGAETFQCPTCKAMLEIKPKKQVRQKKQKVEQERETETETETPETVQ